MTQTTAHRPRYARPARTERVHPSATAAVLAEIAVGLNDLLKVVYEVVVASPSLEAKIVLAAHVYDDVAWLSDLRDRLSELGSADFEADAASPPDCAEAGLRFRAHADDPDRLSAAYCRAKSLVRDRVAACCARLHPLWDEPSLRLLERYDATLARQLAECEEFLSARPARRPPECAASTRAAAWPGPDRELPAEPGRPAGFQIVEIVPRPPHDTPPATLKAALFHHLLMSTEIPTIEHCAALLWEHRAEMPRAFERDMARQMWDEARHAQACLDRLHDLGHAPGDFPIELLLWRMTRGRSLSLRLAIHQRIGEWLGLDAALWWSERFEAEGDAVSADLLQFVARDEHLHVAFGNKWLYVLEKSDVAVDRIQAEAEAIRNCFGTGVNRSAPFPLNVRSCEETGFTPAEIARLLEERGS